jgi:putative membrane protein
MDAFWHNTYFETVAAYSVVILCTVVFLACFELLTKYKNWEEIKKGNLAVAMATGGKILGITNVFHYSIQTGQTLLIIILQGLFGFVLLMIGYFIYEFLTPSFRIDVEIQKDNRAVGFISMVISIGLSFVIGASLV